MVPADRAARRRDGTALDLDVDELGPKSIGRLRGFQGNYGCFVRSYAYIRSLGAEGLQDASETAVLNANYLLARLRELGVAEHLPLAFGELCMHEFVLSGAPMKRELGIKTLDLAKRLLDHGFHPPTVYFPLLVDEALLVEPTETETRETLDAFADAIAEILREAAEDPEIARNAPYTTPVRRLDEARGGEAAGDPPAAGRRGAVERLRRSRRRLSPVCVARERLARDAGGLSRRLRPARSLAGVPALRGRRGEGEAGRGVGGARPPRRPWAEQWTLCGQNSAAPTRALDARQLRAGSTSNDRLRARREHDSRPPEPRLRPRRPRLGSDPTLRLGRVGLGADPVEAGLGEVVHGARAEDRADDPRLARPRDAQARRGPARSTSPRSACR